MNDKNVFSTLVFTIWRTIVNFVLYLRQHMKQVNIMNNCDRAIFLLVNFKFKHNKGWCRWYMTNVREQLLMVLVGTKETIPYQRWLTHIS